MLGIFMIFGERVIIAKLVICLLEWRNPGVRRFRYWRDSPTYCRLLHCDYLQKILMGNYL